MKTCVRIFARTRVPNTPNISAIRVFRDHLFRCPTSLRKETKTISCCRLRRSQKVFFIHCVSVMGMDWFPQWLCCIGEPEAQSAPAISPDQAATRNNRFTKCTSRAVPDSSRRHWRLRIMRMTSKPLIVADAVGSVLNPRLASD